MAVPEAGRRTGTEVLGRFLKGSGSLAVGTMAIILPSWVMTVWCSRGLEWPGMRRRALMRLVDPSGSSVESGLKKGRGLVALVLLVVEVCMSLLLVDTNGGCSTSTSASSLARCGKIVLVIVNLATAKNVVPSLRLCTHE